MDKIIVIDIEKCMGCKSCEFACAVAHTESQDPVKIIQSNQRPGSRISVEYYQGKSVPINCNHCEEAACVMVCPTGAVHRNAKGKPVLVNAEVCIGCRMCVQACPFGVITMTVDGKSAVKCDLCIKRLAKGEQPACVYACPTKALVFIEQAKANKMKRQKIAGNLVMLIKGS